MNALLNQQVSKQIACVFCIMLVDGYAPVWCGADDMVYSELINLEAIEFDGFIEYNGRYVAKLKTVKELLEFRSAYARMIEMYIKANEYFQAARSQGTAELIDYLTKQIGYNVAHEWKQYLIRKQFYPNAKPIEKPF